MIDHMTKPTADGKHPQYAHLVMAEIEPHCGSYILTMAGYDGDALISDEDARHIFGEQYAGEFGYISDEYSEILG